MGNETTAVVKKDQEFAAILSAASGKFKEVAPKWLSVERVTKLMLAARSRNPALAECTSDSVIAFCMRCAETGLEPIGPGGAWPVPFRNTENGTREIQFIADWRGLVQLAKQSGQITHAYGDVVCANDQIDYEKGDAPKLIHKPNLTKRGDVIGAYCVCKLPDGGSHIEYMTKEEIDAVRGRSKASKSGPWVSDYSQMSVKTVTKRALKVFAGGNSHLQTAINFDNEATGLLNPERDRAPIIQPTALSAGPATIEGEIVTPKAQAAVPAQAKAAPKQDLGPTPPPVSGDVVQGIVAVVTQKPGKSSRGDYTKTSVKLEDGEWYGTFSDTIGESAKGLKGERVEIRFTNDGKYNTMTAITILPDEVESPAAVEEPAPAAEVGDDNLPF